MHIATGRQDVGGAQQVAAGGWAHITPVQRMQDACDLAVFEQFLAGAFELLQMLDGRCRNGRIRLLQNLPGLLGRAAVGQCLQHSRWQLQPMPGLGAGLEGFKQNLRPHGLAHHMQSMRDEGVGQLEHRVVDALNLLRCLMAPGRLGLCQFQLSRLGLDQIGQLARFGAVRRLQTAVALKHVLQSGQALVKASLRHRGREVADQRGRRAALGDGAFGRVVRGIQIHIGHVADQPVRPAISAQPALLAGHELERAVGTEMQQGVGTKIFTQPAVEGREGVRGGKAFLKQQAHRIALIAEGRLYAHKHVAEALAQHEQAATVALLTARRRPPGRFDGLEVLFTPDMVVGGDQGVHIGLRAITLGIALDDPLAQRIDAGRHVDPVALALECGQCVVQGLEHTEECRRTGAARIGRKVEQHNADLALGQRRAPQGDQPSHPRSQGISAFAAGVHVVRPDRLEAAALGTTGASAGAGAASAAVDHVAGGAIEFRDRHHHGGLDRQKALPRSAPTVERLEFHRGHSQIRQVQAGQQVLGRARIVVGRPADQGKTGQGHQGVDGGLAVLHEKGLHCRTVVQAAGKGWNDAHATRLQRGDHAVIVSRVAGQDIRAQQQHTHRALGAGGRHPGQVGQTVGQALTRFGLQAGVVEAHLGVLDGWRHFQPAQHRARTGRIAVDEQTDQALNVVLRAGQPVLHGQEIRTHILGGSGNETQDLGQTTQHLHLLFAGAGFFFGAHLAGLRTLAAQLLEEFHRAAAGRLHVELAHAGEFADLAGRHQADHGVALIAPRLEGWQHRQEMLFHEEHGDDDDVALGDVLMAARQR